MTPMGSRRGPHATTAWMQEVEQRKEQLPKEGAVAASRWLAMFFVLMGVMGGCKKEAPPPAEPARPSHRTDFAPEEFGIGRPHTKNARCNREIDRLLEELRACYNRSPTAECDSLQQANGERIRRIENSARCSRR